MQIEIQEKLANDKKMAEYLKMNSEWYKYLNRSPKFYNEFTNQMKEKYKIRATDKMSSFVENIDMISSILGVLK